MGCSWDVGEFTTPDGLIYHRFLPKWVEQCGEDDSLEQMWFRSFCGEDIPIAVMGWESHFAQEGLFPTMFLVATEGLEKLRYPCKNHGRGRRAFHKAK